MKVNIPGESTPDLFLIMWGRLRKEEWNFMGLEE